MNMPSPKEKNPSGSALPIGRNMIRVSSCPSTTRGFPRRRDSNPLRVCRAGRELGDLETDLVDVAPEPVLARLERLDDRMRDRPRVLRRVLVRRRVAAADVAARHAAPQVQ